MFIRVINSMADVAAAVEEAKTGHTVFISKVDTSWAYLHKCATEVYVDHDDLNHTDFVINGVKVVVREAPPIQSYAFEVSRNHMSLEEVPDHLREAVSFAVEAERREMATMGIA